MKTKLTQFLVVIALITFSSCKKESNSEASDSKKGFEKLGVNPKEVGILHNKLMSFTNKNWALFNANKNTDSRINESSVTDLSIQETDVLAAFTNNYLSTDYSNYALTQPELYSIAFSTNLGYYNEYKENYPNVEVDAYDIAPILYIEERNSADSLVNSIYEANLLSYKEKEFIKTALQEFQQVETSRNYTQYPSLLSSLENLYANQNFNEADGEGFLASILVEVAKNSYTYWNDIYPTEIPNSSFALMGWAGCCWSFSRCRGFALEPKKQCSYRLVGSWWSGGDLGCCRVNSRDKMVR